MFHKKYIALVALMALSSLSLGGCWKSKKDDQTTEEKQAQTPKDASLEDKAAEEAAPQEKTAENPQ